MRKIILVLLLALVPATGAFASCTDNPADCNLPPPGNPSNIPEPEILSLLGLGALGFLTTRLIKK
jgi:hypothetical protein